MLTKPQNGVDFIREFRCRAAAAAVNVIGDSKYKDEQRRK